MATDASAAEVASTAPAMTTLAVPLKGEAAVKCRDADMLQVALDAVTVTV